MSNVYLITEERLLELLEAEHELNYLNSDGAVQCEFFEYSLNNYISNTLKIPIEQVKAIGYGIEDLALIDLKSFQKFI